MAVLLQLPLGFYLNSNSLNPISTEKRFMLEGWKKGRGRFSEWKSSCCARSHSSAALFFSFAEAEPRKIISKQRGVATHLALINVGPYGAEPAKQRGRRSRFSRTLPLCAGTCSFNDWVKNQEPRCLKNRAESNLWPNQILTACSAWSRWKHETRSGWTRSEPDSCQGHRVIPFQSLEGRKHLLPMSKNWTSYYISVLRHQSIFATNGALQFISASCTDKAATKELWLRLLTSQHTPPSGPGRNWRGCCRSASYRPSRCTQGRKITSARARLSVKIMFVVGGEKRRRLIDKSETTRLHLKGWRGCAVKRLIQLEKSPYF